uniref:Loricrin n=1 Tax=Ascaris lumbricoides TaxID=6252 RepID=A0A0M3HMR0_ASCLU
MLLIMLTSNCFMQGGGIVLEQSFLGGSRSCYMAPGVSAGTGGYGSSGSASGAGGYGSGGPGYGGAGGYGGSGGSGPRGTGVVSPGRRGTAVGSSVPIGGGPGVQGGQAGPGFLLHFWETLQNFNMLSRQHAPFDSDSPEHRIVYCVNHTNAHSYEHRQRRRRSDISAYVPEGGGIVLEQSFLGGSRSCYMAPGVSAGTGGYGSSGSASGAGGYGSGRPGYGGAGGYGGSGGSGPRGTGVVSPGRRGTAVGSSVPIGGGPGVQGGQAGRAGGIALEQSFLGGSRSCYMAPDASVGGGMSSSGTGGTGAAAGTGGGHSNASNPSPAPAKQLQSVYMNLQH